jgi:hypothetical protein
LVATYGETTRLLALQWQEKHANMHLYELLTQRLKCISRTWKRSVCVCVGGWALLGLCVGRLLTSVCCIAVRKLQTVALTRRLKGCAMERHFCVFLLPADSHFSYLFVSLTVHWYPGDSCQFGPKV